MTAHTPPFVWTHHGLAEVEVTKFLRTQEPGKWERKELLSVAVEAMLRSPGVNYARDEAIPGALRDFVRDSEKVVHNIEMKEERYLRAWGDSTDADGPRHGMGRVANAALRAVAKRKAERKTVPPGIVLRVEDGVTYLSPALYRSNAQLLRGDGKIDSKHNKVSVRIWRSSYDDEIGPNGSWKRAKVEDPEGGEEDVVVAAQADPATYGDRPKGNEKTLSAGGLNKGVGDWSRCHDDGIVEVYNPNPPLLATVRHRTEPPPRPWDPRGRRTDWGAAMELRNRQRRRWWWRDHLQLMDRPGLLRGPSWHKEAGYFDVAWGLPRPSFEEIFRGKDCSKRILTAPRNTRWRPPKTKIAARWTDATPRRADGLFVRSRAALETRGNGGMLLSGTGRGRP